MARAVHARAGHALERKAQTFGGWCSVPSAAISDVLTRRITIMNALEVMPLDKREASSEVSLDHRPKMYRTEIKDFTSVRPMSALVRGYDRVAICEMILYKHWRESLVWNVPEKVW